MCAGLTGCAGSGKTWTGIPIIAANMDTTGTFAMAKVFAKHKMLVAMSKHIEVEEVRRRAGVRAAARLRAGTCKASCTSLI
jgi:ABC-type dipeptide/oligopeptide/nickel transport system ATPase component